MKTCRNCTLSDAVFTVRIGEDGVCNYCAEKTTVAGMSQEALAAADRTLREAFDLYRDRPYQVLLAYSGGKDSTFAMQTLREKYGRLPFWL